MAILGTQHHFIYLDNIENCHFENIMENGVFAPKEQIIFKKNHYVSKASKGVITE